MLQGAHRSGILTVARTPCSTAQIAAALNMAESRVVNICHALDAHGVFVQKNGHYQLADQWAVLAAPEAILPFQDVLANAFAQTKALTNSATGVDDYWTMTPNERIALAKGAHLDNPASPFSPALVEMLFFE